MLSARKNWVNQSHEFRRRYERKIYRAEVMFACNDRLFDGTLLDIGLGGAFIQTRNVDRFWEGDRVTVTIPFTNGAKNVRRSGFIAWKNGQGMAVAFAD